MKIIVDKKYQYFNFIDTKIVSILKNNRLSQFAGIIQNKSNLKIYRDALGINKIFFFLKKNKIYISSNYFNLSKKTSKDEQIYSCPPGTIISISKNKLIKKKYDYIKKNKFNEKSYLNDLKKKIIKELLLIKKKFPKHNFIICLSSGHDSNLILTYARKILGKRIKISSFAYIEKNKIKKQYEKNFEENINLLPQDFKFAYKISKILNIDFIPVFFSLNDIKKNLRKIIFACQDYRDFNVHCAIGNFFIAKKIKQSKKTIVLTGDLMNEFFADYQTEVINSKKYYNVPNTNFKIKQKAFIVGLETSDREVGIFNFYGIKLRQIFSIARDLAYSIPEKKLKIKNFRQQIHQKLINKNIYKHMYPTKIRAQLGKSKISPTIPYSLEKNGIDSSKLKKIWLSLFSRKYKYKNNIIFLSQYNSI